MKMSQLIRGQDGHFDWRIGRKKPTNLVAGHSDFAFEDNIDQWSPVTLSLTLLNDDIDLDW